MQFTITRKVVSVVLTIVIAFAVVFAFLSVASHTAPDSTFAAFGVQIASAFGGDGGGSSGGDGGGSGDGGGCCGGDGGGGGVGGPPDEGPNPGSYVEPTPPPPAPVVAAPVQVVCTLSANPTSFPVGGGNTTLAWSTTGATSASINQGIGSVALSGSQSASVTSSRTYTLTATGPGGTVTCNAPVTVAVALAPVCTLSANPTSFPAGGGNTTLTWTTTNATSASINQGIGVVTLDGSQNAAVTSSRTYTLTATGPGGTVTCNAPVTVAPVAGLSCDSFTASPNSFGVGGGTTTLTWATTGATSVSINQGIGAVSVDGSQSASVTSSRTYTLTATNGTNTVTCQAPVTVTPPSGLSCDSFSASPNSFGVGGGNTTLTWNTTGATSVSIDQGVGAVAVDGSQSVSVNSSRTYTLSASNGTNTVTCTAPVSVETSGGGGGGGGGGSSAPRCDEFRASDTDIEEGDTVTLSWETRRGTRLVIEPNVLETRDDDLIDDGDIRVKPNRTTKYTLTVYKGSRKDTCSVTVRVDDIELPDRQPVTSISFREIPYTGFEAGPMLTSLFYTLLALWGAAVAYVLVIKREPVFGFSLPARKYATGQSAFIPRQDYHFPNQYAETPAVAATVATAPVNLPTHEAFTNTWKTVATPTVESHATSEDFVTRLENDAHAHNILLSSDALRLIAEHGDTPEDAVALLATLMERAKASFPREDGWIVLNRERVMGLLS